MSRKILVDDPVILRLLPRLGRARALEHTGRSFLEHLLCTWRILADWHMPTAVCRAGFLHSAYSTSFYPEALFHLDERPSLSRMIGHEAEDLVFRFCTMERRGFWDRLVETGRTGPFTYGDRTRDGAQVSVERETLSRLLIIESANVAEQTCARDRGPAAWVSDVVRWWRFLPPQEIPISLDERAALSGEDEHAAIAAYRAALTAPPARAVALLDEAIALNPWVAEPRILRVLCAHDREDVMRVDLDKAERLISAWAVAWDKRLSAAAWRELSRRSSALYDNDCTELSFETIAAVLRGEMSKPAWLAI